MSFLYYQELGMSLMILVMGKFSLIFFLFLMFIGGCAGSTACGIKIFRLQMLLIFLKNQIKKLIYPNSVIINKYNNHKISNDLLDP